MVLFTSWSLTILGKSPGVSSCASPPGIYILSTPNNQFPTSLQKFYDDWVCVLLKQGREVEKGSSYPMGELWHLSLPQPPWASWPFPCWVDFHQQVQCLGKHSGPLHHDMAYLLVCLGDTTEERQYGVSLVWVSPKQARASTMEEAVEKLAAYPSSGTDWPYILTQLYEGSGHAPLPKGKQLGILPQGKAVETSCGQISQLDIHQILSAGPQVVYPSGLNGHDEPVITTLPEPLSSGTSIISNEHPYLEIDIPPGEASDTKVLPIGEVSLTQTTTPPKSSHNPEGSMMAEVTQLLKWAIMETTNGRSEESSLEKIATEGSTSESQGSQFHPSIHHLRLASMRQKDH